MSKKHFKAIAAWLVQQYLANEITSPEQLKRMCLSLAGEISVYNPRFDRDRFVHYVMERAQRS